MTFEFSYDVWLRMILFFGHIRFSRDRLFCQADSWFIFILFFLGTKTVFIFFFSLVFDFINKTTSSCAPLWLVLVLKEFEKGVRVVNQLVSDFLQCIGIIFGDICVFAVNFLALIFIFQLKSISVTEASHIVSFIVYWKSWLSFSFLLDL